MNIEILGSSAGGGLPQWNCGCPNCIAVRAGEPGISARSQDSIAVSADGSRWLLCNASPDIAAQLAASPRLHPRTMRESRINAIVLTNGDVDHCLGLFNLRESQPLAIYATETVWRGLAEHNVLVRTLQRFAGHTTWRRLVLDEPIEVADPDGAALGLTITARPVHGKRPVHLELGNVAPVSPEDNVGLEITAADGKRMAYVPGAARADAVRVFGRVDCLLFDGTFWTDDEMIRLAAGTGRASSMAHLPISGDDGSLAALAAYPAARRIYTHINNTNPMLRDGSAERRAVEAAGWEVAYDGMRLTL
jgi:pyrroloquinoline quinone biosynthesis protein B